MIYRSILGKVVHTIHIRNFSQCRNLLAAKTLGGETFEEVEKKMDDKQHKESPGELLGRVTNNKDSYNKFYKDFSASVASQGQMTSFEEQKSFHKIFNYLKNEYGQIGITDTVKKIAGFNEEVESTSSLTSEKSSVIRKKFEDKLERNRELMESLLPTLQYINKKITNSEQLCEFVKKSVLQRFLDDKDFLKKHSNDEINEASIKDPANPLVDKETLPVLLKFCLNSLTNDFESLDDALNLVNYIKKHQSIELYEFGMNIYVYNFLLKELWSKTENLQLISRIVDELRINAIPPDLVTYKILAEIYLKCMDVKDVIKAEPYLLWGNSSDIHKVKHFIEDIKVPN